MPDSEGGDAPPSTYIAATTLKLYTPKETPIIIIIIIIIIIVIIIIIIIVIIIIIIIIIIMVNIVPRVICAKLHHLNERRTGVSDFLAGKWKLIIGGESP